MVARIAHQPGLTPHWEVVEVTLLSLTFLAHQTGHWRIRLTGLTPPHFDIVLLTGGHRQRIELNKGFLKTFIAVSLSLRRFTGLVGINSIVPRDIGPLWFDDHVCGVFPCNVRTALLMASTSLE